MPGSKPVKRAHVRENYFIPPDAFSNGGQHDAAAAAASADAAAAAAEDVPASDHEHGAAQPGRLRRGPVPPSAAGKDGKAGRRTTPATAGTQFNDVAIFRLQTDGFTYFY